MVKLEFALQVMVIGFMVVMVTLVLLYGILIIFSRIFRKPVKTEKSSETDFNNSAAIKAETEQAKIVAAITAAISSYFNDLKPPFIIRKISLAEQTGNGSAVSSWQITGRKQLMNGNTDLETIRRNKKREKI